MTARVPGHGVGTSLARVPGALLFALSAAGAACTREIATSHDPSPQDDPVSAVTVPDGGRCGPVLANAETTGFADAGACEGDGGTPTFSPSSPIGVGYPDIPTPLPAHVAFLTFDDGPVAWTDAFLDILASRGVHATFFVNAKGIKGPAGLDGSYAEADGGVRVFRDVLRREVDDGHVIGSHTVNHPDLGTLTAEQIETELDENELLVNVALVRAGATPQVLSLFRPPYGSPWFGGAEQDQGPTGEQVVVTEQGSVGQLIPLHGVNVMWTLDSTDSAEWAQGESPGPGYVEIAAPGAPTYEAKMARIKQTVLGAPAVVGGEGIVLLMHDTHNTTRDVLASIIDGLIADGYSFQTIEQYVQARWSRPSLDLAPGPELFSNCVAEKDQGCAAFGAPVGTNRADEVCGRMWLAYEAFGGLSVLGQPAAAPRRSATTGVVSQPFAHGTLELHPENPAPCNIVLIPQ
jgi:peptidoglycan/xylan/chitin deacetylase (PgdA/CDA1 family)